jgi:hypothetical protein
VQETLTKQVAAIVQKALGPPPAADDGVTVEEGLPPSAKEDQPQPAADAEPAPAADAEPRPVEEFTEDDPEDVWVRGLYFRTNRGIGDAQRNGDWSKYPIDNGVIEMVRQAAEAWQELYDYLKQRDGH